MKVLIDIGHPAHVHYYKNLAIELKRKGHTVLWTVKDIEIAKQLLSIFGFDFIIFPKKSDNLIGKVVMQFQFNLKLLFICLKHRVNIAIGTSASIAHVSRLSSIKSVVFDDDDDDVQPLVTKYVHPFATYLLSPDCLRGKRIRKDTIYYPGYHELSYLHPNRFTPDSSVLGELGLQPDMTYFIMRFNVFKAHHDRDIVGLSLNQKLKLIEILVPYGKVYITTERDIEPELVAYQLKLSPEKIHSLLAFSTIFLSDSQTMTSEAAVLGVPSLRCNSFAGRISYIEEEENRYQLTYGYKPENFNQLILKLKELLILPNLKEEWAIRRKKMLSDKIDVTLFWVWFIENLPTNSNCFNSDIAFWNRFK